MMTRKELNAQLAIKPSAKQLRKLKNELDRHRPRNFVPDAGCSLTAMQTTIQQAKDFIGK